MASLVTTSGTCIQSKEWEREGKGRGRGEERDREKGGGEGYLIGNPVRAFWDVNDLDILHPLGTHGTFGNECHVILAPQH